MTEDQSTVVGTDAHAAARRTVSFFADPAASTHLLEEAVDSFIASTSTECALIDLSTVAGLTIAAAFRRAGLPYLSAEFGQEDRVGEGPHTDYDPAEVRGASDDSVELELSELGDLAADLVVVPAEVDAGGVASENRTTLGTVIGAFERAGRPYWRLLPPERGHDSSLVARGRRRVVRVE